VDLMKPPGWLLDLLPQGGKDFLTGGGWFLVLGVVALVVLVIVLLFLRGVLRALFGGGKKGPDLEKGLRENLAEYPPPPGKPGPRRVVIDGQPARMRLVVIAPMGKAASIDASKAEQLLEHVNRGLGDFVAKDKPRVKIWPPQLSIDGFRNTFHRLTRKPEPEGKPTRWVLLAGQARVGKQFILLGMALLTDQTNSLGPIMMEPDHWTERLKIKG
jgi:hypothetical protein